jgi:hypothetical protein
MQCYQALNKLIELNLKLKKVAELKNIIIQGVDQNKGILD